MTPAELLGAIESHLRGGGTYEADVEGMGSYRVVYVAQGIDRYVLTGTVSGGPANVVLASGLRREGDTVTAISTRIGEVIRNMDVCAPLEKWTLMEDSGAAQRSSAEGE